MIHHAFDQASQWEAANPDLIKQGISKDWLFWAEIERFAARTKHVSFAPELEYRLVVGGSVDGYLSQLRYRSSRSTLVPYVAMGLPDPDRFLPGVGHKEPIFKFPDLPEPYFIDNVTIGPTPHTQLSAESLVAFFEDANRDVVVRSSEVPYRDW